MITKKFLGFPVSREIETSFIGSDGNVLAQTVAQDLWHFYENNRLLLQSQIGWETDVTEYVELRKLRVPFPPDGIIYRRVPIGQGKEGHHRAHALLTPSA